jgi:hypothetical protein
MARIHAAYVPLTAAARTKKCRSSKEWRTALRVESR